MVKLTRLLLKLVATENSSYEMDYYRDIQGLIYNLLRGSDYNLHDKKGFKFFSFSQIFPFHNLHKGDRRNLIIASPSRSFIYYLKEQLSYLQDIRIGAMQFKLDYANVLNLQVPENSSLITGTPIVMRLQQPRYQTAGGQQSQLQFVTGYWRKNYPISIFAKQLGDNLVKKYNEFYGYLDNKTLDNEDIFYRFRFMREMTLKVTVSSDYKSSIVASKWIVGIADSRLAKFALDCGLGERNSLGFGFMNPVYEGVTR